MQIYIAGDHGGFSDKQALVSFLQSKDLEVHDLGAHSLEPGDDYPIYAKAVSEEVGVHAGSKGILLCRSGEGMAMTANRYPGIRAAVVWNTTVARETREDNDANVAVIPADFLDEGMVIECVQIFLDTPFSKEERHIRRIQLMERESNGN